MASNCIKHSEFEKSHYCTDCGISLCIGCVMEHNSKHKVVAYADLATKIMMDFTAEYEKDSKTATKISELNFHIKQNISYYWDQLKLRVSSLIDDFKHDNLAFIEGVLGKPNLSITIGQKADVMKKDLLSLFKKKDYLEITKRKGTVDILSKWLAEDASKKAMLQTLCNNMVSPASSLKYLESTLLQLENNVYSSIESLTHSNYGSFIEGNNLSLLYYPSYVSVVHFSNLPQNVSIAQAQNGIYIIGGNAGGWELEHYTTTYLYYSLDDNAKNSLIQKATLKEARAWHSVFTVLDSYIYAVGGYNNISGTLNSCERYEVKRDKWTIIPPLLCKRWSASLTCFNERFLYVFYGMTQKILCKSIEKLDLLETDMGWVLIYEPEIGIERARRRHASFQVSSKEILVFGGDTGKQMEKISLLFNTHKESIKIGHKEFSCIPHQNYNRYITATYSNVLFKLECANQAAAYNMLSKSWITFELSLLKSTK